MSPFSAWLLSDTRANLRLCQSSGVRADRSDKFCIEDLREVDRGDERETLQLGAPQASGTAAWYGKRSCMSCTTLLLSCLQPGP